MQLNNSIEIKIKILQSASNFVENTEDLFFVFDFNLCFGFIIVFIWIHIRICLALQSSLF